MIGLEKEEWENPIRTLPLVRMAGVEPARSRNGT